ncbi:ATP-dependent helicase [Elysia marginata]|uniref:ATP-dependent DNA helicase n=1 Tax=Elysia marginata TaxID=1093978 RepID=A0AAV4ERW4_9GAST|nr:ATP-dependent helicase [Elysia marginata]
MFLPSLTSASCWPNILSALDNHSRPYTYAIRLGLLENDAQWRNTTEEAASSQSPRQLRQLFSIMLTSCELVNPVLIWDELKERMSEDFLFQARCLASNSELLFSNDIFNQSLVAIEDQVLAAANHNINMYGLPQPTRETDPDFCREVLQEKGYNCDQQKKFIEENEPLLTPEQIDAYHNIMQKIQRGHGGIIFLDAPGGTGKTFLINLLLAKIRQRRETALAVASSGIAVTLLPGGRTAHSAFKLPLTLTKEEYPLCRVKKNSVPAKVLQQCTLIVWDECTMSHKHAIEALNNTLRDLRKSEHLMGGVTLLLSGDFRQTLSIIQRGGAPADEINACIKYSFLWAQVEELHLRTNMRSALFGDSNALEFSHKLLCTGEGQLSVDEGLSSVADIGTIVQSLPELIEKVYPDLTLKYKDLEWLSEREILCPKNDAVTEVNHQLLIKLPGELSTYKSVDTALPDESIVEYPAEFLNSLEPSGTPPHSLMLKIGAPIMLLRNLNPPKLCNGTRLIVKTLFPENNRSDYSKRARKRRTRFFTQNSHSSN